MGKIRCNYLKIAFKSLHAIPIARANPIAPTVFLFSSAVCMFGEKVVCFLCKKKQLNHAFCNIFLT
jgi:hypothetical protein